MLRIRPTRPNLEYLERRLAPATVRLASGNLYVSHQVGALTITAQGGGKFTVADGAKAVTVGGVAGLIQVTGTNVGNKITFDANGKAFPGNLLISGGNGADEVVVEGGGAGGKIGGNVTVLP